MAKQSKMDWKQQVLNHEEHFIALESEPTGDPISGEFFLTNSPLQAIYHGNGKSVIRVVASELDPSGFQKPNPTGLVKGTTADDWIEKWFRGSSIDFHGTISKYEVVDIYSGLESKQEISLGATQLDRGSQFQGLSQLLLPDLDLRIKIWSGKFEIYLGKSRIISRLDDLDEDLNQHLHSEYFKSILTLTLKSLGNPIEVIFSGSIEDDLIESLVAEYNNYKSK